ncbi:hypothetical protein ZOD2009_20472 [Haladaptatus paucihalophilus DX253]|uniref:Uncharacterized protein n=1 Tax=Haladaptatus paucihalophilus DX253 TaxID=797209 RepID=E7QZ87_HALPU|nr:hypothetical protein ZOD2009_20472 [Haladaptatus paucihalophilus DX253]
MNARELVGISLTGRLFTSFVCSALDVAVVAPFGTW